MSDRDRHRDRDRKRDRSRSRDRDRDRRSDRDRHRERSRDDDRSRERHRDKDSQRERSGDRPRDRDSERERSGSSKEEMSEMDRNRAARREKEKEKYQYSNWKKGYTLAPPNPEGNGDFTILDKDGNLIEGDAKDPTKKESTPPKEEEAEESKEGEDGEEGEDDKPKGKTIPEICGTKNPVMWLNEQSKSRRMRMEWDQVSEQGAPHERTYTWRLKMGDLETNGEDNSKKGAKIVAAEEMAKKLDALGPGYRGTKPSMPSAGKGAGAGSIPMDVGYGGMPPFGGPPMGHMGHMGHMGYPPMGGGFRPGFGPPPMGMYGGGPMRPPPFFGGGGRGMPPPWMMRPRGPAPDLPGGAAPASSKPKYLHPAQNNPISKLYEYSKKFRTPEPIFETIKEEVLSERKTHQGFVIKKIEFTVECRMNGKKYEGQSIVKKDAKSNAAAMAWAAVDAEIA
jgi:hypothetical protein